LGAGRRRVRGSYEFIGDGCILALAGDEGMPPG
jgi:hypothetical protein